LGCAIFGITEVPTDGLDFDPTDFGTEGLMSGGPMGTAAMATATSAAAAAGASAATTPIYVPPPPPAAPTAESKAESAAVQESQQPARTGTGTPPPIGRESSSLSQKPDHTSSRAEQVPILSSQQEPEAAPVVDLLDDAPVPAPAQQQQQGETEVSSSTAAASKEPRPALEPQHPLPGEIHDLD